jgi:hypothetical protein
MTQAFLRVCFCFSVRLVGDGTSQGIGCHENCHFAAAKIDPNEDAATSPHPHNAAKILLPLSWILRDYKLK